MNNVDVDSVRCDKDEYGNLIPRENGYLIHCAAVCNGTTASLFFRHYIEEHCDPEESYWW